MHLAVHCCEENRDLRGYGVTFVADDTGLTSANFVRSWLVQSDEALIRLDLLDYFDLLDSGTACSGYSRRYAIDVSKVGRAA